jgi:ribosomal protein L36
MLNEECQLVRSNGYVMIIKNNTCEREQWDRHSVLVSPKEQKENSELFQGIWSVRVGTGHDEA